MDGTVASGAADAIGKAGTGADVGAVIPELENKSMSSSRGFVVGTDGPAGAVEIMEAMPEDPMKPESACDNGSSASKSSKFSAF